VREVAAQRVDSAKGHAFLSLKQVGVRLPPVPSPVKQERVRVRVFGVRASCSQ
jgi:hypothetical protein